MQAARLGSITLISARSMLPNALLAKSDVSRAKAAGGKIANHAFLKVQPHLSHRAKATAFCVARAGIPLMLQLQAPEIAKSARRDGTKVKKV